MAFYCLELISKDENGLKLEKVGPTLIRFLQKLLVSYFHSDLLYHPLILSKDFKGQWIILKIHSCSSPCFIRGFKQRRF